MIKRIIATPDISSFNTSSLRHLFTEALFFFFLINLVWTRSENAEHVELIQSGDGDRLTAPMVEHSGPVVELSWEGSRCNAFKVDFFDRPGPYSYFMTAAHCCLYALGRPMKIVAGGVSAPFNPVYYNHSGIDWCLGSTPETNGPSLPMFNGDHLPNQSRLTHLTTSWYSNEYTRCDVSLRHTGGYFIYPFQAVSGLSGSPIVINGTAFGIQSASFDDRFGIFSRIPARADILGTREEGSAPVSYSVQSCEGIYFDVTEHQQFSNGISRATQKEEHRSDGKYVSAYRWEKMSNGMETAEKLVIDDRYGIHIVTRSDRWWKFGHNQGAETHVSVSKHGDVTTTSHWRLIDNIHSGDKKVIDRLKSSRIIEIHHKFQLSSNGSYKCENLTALDQTRGIVRTFLNVNSSQPILLEPGYF